MKVVKIYRTMIDKMLDYWEAEKETILEKECDVK